MSNLYILVSSIKRNQTSHSILSQKDNVGPWLYALNPSGIRIRFIAVASPEDFHIFPAGRAQQSWSEVLRNHQFENPLLNQYETVTFNYMTH